MELLRQQKIGFARITPKDLNPAKGNLTIEQFGRKNAGRFARQSPGTLGALLNGERKPPPVIGTTSGQAYASVIFASLTVAKAARGGKRVPDDVWGDIGSLPGLRIDRASFARDGFDVVFRMWATDVSDREKEIWARVGTVDTRESGATLEQKLMQAMANLGGGGVVPPQGPPKNSEMADNEPGDGKRGELLINRIGEQEVAVFANSRDKVMAVGRISG